MERPKWFRWHAVGLSKIMLPQAAINILNGAMDLTTKIGWSHPIALLCMRVNYGVVQRTHGHTQHAQSPMRSRGLFDFLSCWWALMCCGENRVVGRTFPESLYYPWAIFVQNDCQFGARILRERNLTFGSENPTHKDRPNRSSERYVFYVFNFAYEPPKRCIVWYTMVWE